MHSSENALIEHHGSLNHNIHLNGSYLYRLLQGLFKINEIRAAVKRNTNCLDPHLRDLFGDLQRRTADTKTIVNQLGIDSVYEQCDAAEYFEKILTRTSPDTSRIFHGELTRTTICSKCQTRSSTDSKVWYLPLALTDSYCEEYRVVDGIEEYFRESQFSGQDQMYCDRCDDKADVTVTCDVKHHPQVLVLLLKRFDFDYRYMRYVKNNRAVKVPLTLQVPASQTYELYAAVDHVGDLRGGHYTAAIKSQDDEQWYNFCDSSVRRLDFQPFQVDDTAQSQCAYLLFYRKLTSTAPISTSQPANVKYHGLLNQGATCYLNSVLQVLFMTREFREAVQRTNDDLGQHLEVMCEVIKKLGINTVCEQHGSVQPSPDASQVQGPLKRTTIRCTCQTGRSTDSPVWILHLALEDSHSEEYRVVDGFQEYFRDSNLSGRDQMYCGQCGDKVDVITTCDVKHHPQVLVLLLKRFEFDYSNMSYVKNNRSVEFCCTLQTPESQTYELYAAVDHVGDLRGGHYTAAIKSQDDEQWYNFCDSTQLHHLFQMNNTEKSTSACLLFYRKQEHTSSQEIREVSTSEGFLPATRDSYGQRQANETDTERQEVEEPADVGTDTDTERQEVEEPADLGTDTDTERQEVEEPADVGTDTDTERQEVEEPADVGTDTIKERQEVEEAADVGTDTAETVSPDTHEAEGIRVHFEPVVPEPKASYVEKEDSGEFVRQSEPHGETDEGKIRRHEGENRRRNEADDQTGRIEHLPTGTNTDESSEDQKADKDPQSKRDFTPELSHTYPTQDALHKQNPMSIDLRTVRDVRTDTDKHTVGDEQSENLHRNTEHQVCEGAHDVRLKLNKARERELEARPHIRPACEDDNGFKVIAEGKPRDETIRKGLLQYTEEVWAREHEHQGAKERVEGRERGDDGYVQNREKPIVKYECEGAGSQDNRKLSCGNAEYFYTEHRGDEEIIKFQIRKDKKHGNEEGAGVKPQNKSDESYQKGVNNRTRNLNSRQSEQGEKKSDGKTKAEDVRRAKGSSGRYSGGGAEDHRKQRQQQSKHEDLDDQDKRDEKKTEKAGTQRCRADDRRERTAGSIGKGRQTQDRDKIEGDEVNIVPSNDENVQNESEAQTERVGTKQTGKQKAEKNRKRSINPESEDAHYQHNRNLDPGTLDCIEGGKTKKKNFKQQRKQKKKEKSECHCAGCFGWVKKRKTVSRLTNRGEIH